MEGAAEIEEQAHSASALSTRSSSRMTPLGAVAQSLTAKLLIVGLNALTGVLSARSLEPAGRGALTALTLWPVFLGSALTLGIPSALTYQSRRNNHLQSELVGSALMIGVVTGSIGALIGFVCLPYWIPQYSAHTILWARLLVLSCPMQSIALLGRSALESEDDFTTSNSVLLAGPVLTAVGLVVLILSHRIAPVPAAAVYVGSGVLPIVWMLWRLWQRFQPRLRNVASSTRLLLGYGVASYGVDLCGSLAIYVDQALVVRMLAPGAMGAYVVALSVSRMLNVFHASVVIVLFPKTVGLPADVVTSITARAARVTTLLTASAGSVLLLLGPQVLTLMYGANFRDAGQVLRLLVLEVVMAGATTVLSQAFMALGRPGVVTVLQILGLTATVPLLLILVPRFGIAGAGMALLLSTLLRLCFVLASYPLFLRRPVPSLRPTTDDVTSLLHYVRTRWQRQ